MKLLSIGLIKMLRVSTGEDKSEQITISTMPAHRVKRKTIVRLKKRRKKKEQKKLAETQEAKISLRDQRTVCLTTTGDVGDGVCCLSE